MSSLLCCSRFQSPYPRSHSLRSHCRLAGRLGRTTVVCEVETLFVCGCLFRLAGRHDGDGSNLTRRQFSQERKIAGKAKIVCQEACPAEAFAHSRTEMRCFNPSNFHSGGSRSEMPPLQLERRQKRGLRPMHQTHQACQIRKCPKRFSWPLPVVRDLLIKSRYHRSSTGGARGWLFRLKHALHSPCDLAPLFSSTRSEQSIH